MSEIKLILGNSNDKLKELPDNSVDTVITDPPYGLSFMGKKWDYDVPSVELWKEVLRVLKPGGTAIIFAGSRTQHRMAVNVEDTGFILKDTIMWLYASGFPKATDISKQIDKKFGAEREVVGKNINHRTLKKTNCMVGQPHTRDGNLTKPSTPEAKLWDGWKSHGLKPAYEPIIVAMKPNDGTYASNALKWGVSGLWIDGGRVPLQQGEDLSIERSGNKKLDTNEQGGGFKSVSRGNEGRFPANVILDEEASKLLDEQTKGRVGNGHWAKTKVSGFGEFGNGKSEYKGVGRKDKSRSGGASRFFYCAKASKSERNKGLDNLPYRLGSSLEGDNDKRNNKNIPQLKLTKNFHPTVKPLKLMEYLCTITKTPTGGVVLDPFMGSGTTGIACKNTGRGFIGIELNKEYFEIARVRINNDSY